MRASTGWAIENNVTQGKQRCIEVSGICIRILYILKVHKSNWNIFLIKMIQLAI